MTFADAASYPIQFGKYKLQSIDKIATEDEGLKYLDWLRGQGWVRGPLRSALEVYLEDPAIKRDLQALLSKGGAA